MDWVMGNGKRNSDRGLLRSKKRGQAHQDKVRYCEIEPIECNCLGECKKKGGH